MCHDEQIDYCAIPTLSPPTVSPSENCASPSYYKDGDCDNDNNHLECNFDGGDCCKGNETSCTYCTDNCMCHAEGVDYCEGNIIFITLVINDLLGWDGVGVLIFFIVGTKFVFDR